MHADTNSFAGRGAVVYFIDDEDDRAYHAAILDMAHVGCDHFSEPLDALCAFLSTPPQLLIVDLDVVGTSWQSFLGLLKASPWHREIPLLVCSGEQASPERQQETFDAGADGYLEKPFVEEEFLEAVRCLLGMEEPAVEQQDSPEAPLPALQLDLSPPPGVAPRAAVQ